MKFCLLTKSLYSS